jgi:hypothetical protein
LYIAASIFQITSKQIAYPKRPERDIGSHSRVRPFVDIRPFVFKVFARLLGIDARKLAILVVLLGGLIRRFSNDVNQAQRLGGIFFPPGGSF